MKSRSQFLVSVVFCLVLFPSKGEVSNEATPGRNIRMGKPDPNGTGISIASRIHGGTTASEGQFTYMVFLLSYPSENARWPETSCSASLIHSKWVLTAAHCVSPAMIAVAGRANLANYWLEHRSKLPFSMNVDERELGVQERKVRRQFVHPRYSTKDNVRDLALLLLDEPFNVSPNHQPPVTVITLARNKMTSKMSCTALGWGLDDSGYQTFRLMFTPKGVRASTPALGCKYYQNGPFICLEMGGPGICKGDSGSPLVCESQVWGVASFSLSEPGSSNSEEEYYSQIYEELDWIADITTDAGEMAAPSAPVLFLPIVSVLLFANCASFAK